MVNINKTRKLAAPTFDNDLDAAHGDLIGGFHEHVDYNLNNLYKSYVKSGVWKCNKSPTNAHRWVNTDSNNFRCVYCNEVTTFPTNISDAYLPYGIRYCRSMHMTSSRKSSNISLAKVDAKPMNLHGQPRRRTT